MAELRDKIEAEFENIELLLKEIPSSEKLPLLSFFGAGWRGNFAA